MQCKVSVSTSTVTGFQNLTKGGLSWVSDWGGGLGVGTLKLYLKFSSSKSVLYLNGLVSPSPPTCHTSATSEQAGGGEWVDGGSFVHASALSEVPPSSEIALRASADSDSPQEIPEPSGIKERGEEQKKKKPACHSSPPASTLSSFCGRPSPRLR